MIESISRNFVERFVVCQGHAVDKPVADYGYDIVITTFNYNNDPSFSQGEVENGSIFVQLKATDRLDVLADKETISFPISRKYAHYWRDEPYPVYLVVYSVTDDEAYWLHMQPYLKAASFAFPDPAQDEVTVHLSKSRVVDANSVEVFREAKADVLSLFEGADQHG